MKSEEPLRTRRVKFIITDAFLVQIERLPVFYKQRDALFFPPWAYVVPTTLGRLPVSFVESTIWVDECMLQTFCAFLQRQAWFCILRHYMHCSPRRATSFWIWTPSLAEGHLHVTCCSNIEKVQQPSTGVHGFSGS